MSGNVHPNPCPVFSCSVCTGNVTWPGTSVQCCTCSNWVHLKCSLLSFSRFRTLAALTPGAALLAVFLLFLRSHPYQHCHFLLGLLQLVYLHCSIWPVWRPLLLMQHSHTTLAFKPSILFPPTLYLLPLHPHHRLMLAAAGCFS